MDDNTELTQRRAGENTADPETTQEMTQNTTQEMIIQEDIEKEADTSPGNTSLPFPESKEAGDVLGILSRLEEKVDSLNTLFAQKIQYSAHEEKIVDQMHAELQKYKEDMYSQLVRPILLDMIEVRDSIQRITKNYMARPAEEQNVPLKTFSGYTYDIQDILEKNNVTVYEGQEGDTFNPARQRAVKKIKTPVEELHGKIAESLSSGYDYTGRIISPEKVAVYVYEKPECGKGDNQ